MNDHRGASPLPQGTGMPCGSGLAPRSDGRHGASRVHQSSSSSSAVPRMLSRVKPNSSNNAEAGADSP
ncbi:hypothetical protein DMX07_18900 [Pseudomonas soli]|uniref:Uncharacterized protein n=1 Tax=Pseudomonas soli TaxID=1306993 RepID=A0A2V4HW58_9PSED|nr:hypothetical protein DMX07_18900 [Pseudomonas soli]